MGIRQGALQSNLNKTRNGNINLIFAVSEEHLSVACLLVNIHTLKNKVT